MRTSTKWIVAGGAAALVITPVAAVYGSPTLETELEQGGLVVDAEAANRARAARATPTPATSAPATSAPAASAPVTSAPVTSSDGSGSTARPPARAEAGPGSSKAAERKEPSGKKTVSAASPVSPTSPRSPKSPDTPH